MQMPKFRVGDPVIDAHPRRDEQTLYVTRVVPRSPPERGYVCKLTFSGKPGDWEGVHEDWLIPADSKPAMKFVPGSEVRFCQRTCRVIDWALLSGDLVYKLEGEHGSRYAAMERDLGDVPSQVELATLAMAPEKLGVIRSDEADDTCRVGVWVPSTRYMDAQPNANGDVMPDREKAIGDFLWSQSLKIFRHTSLEALGGRRIIAGLLDIPENPTIQPFTRKPLHGFVTYEPPVSSAKQERTEAPCRICSRANDIGVRTCWSCGGTP